MIYIFSIVMAASTAGADVQKTPTGLSIQYMQCEADQKLEQLVLFLKYHQDEKVIVYFLTCSCVDFFHLALKRLGPQFIPSVKVHALHGRMKQAAREATLEAYTSQPAGCLLCTDLAARGLDIPDVNWIVQVDPPQVLLIWNIKFTLNVDLRITLKKYT